MRQVILNILFQLIGGFVMCPVAAKSTKKTSPYNIVQNKTLYVLGRPVESLLNIPGATWVCWKDEDGYFLGGNDVVVEKSCLANRRDVVGAHDNTLFPKQLVCRYLKADKQVFNGGCAKQFAEYTVCKSGDLLRLLTTKIPIYDSSDSIRGVFVMSCCLSEEKMPVFDSSKELDRYVVDLAKEMRDLNSNIPRRIIVGDIELTGRESACVYYLVKGFSCKQIALKLSISDRTVQALLNNAKNRFGFRYKTELVEKIFDSGVM
jgi:DNA-binding CsgD family transcriptional regulator